MVSTKTPSGMRDFLPEEKSIRERVKAVIQDEYSKNGYIEIETSQIENLENLLKSDGGENTKLIFKILKRGEKFQPSSSSTEDELCDLGLRFDLTLPLTRYYANNRNSLPPVFKALQMGYVFRAERPGKGRYRTFMQCDVDIIGDESNMAEIEVLATVYKTLKRIGLRGITFKINDRRILKQLIEKSGFSSDKFTDVAISLDKIDKIGKEGIVKELREKGYAEGSISKLLELSSVFDEKGLAYAEELCPEGYENLNEIISTLKSLYSDMDVIFDCSLVRGMGYYTGTIFEVYYEGSKSALGGGGRYDEMVEKMCGVSAPAAGFSIGYERLVDIIMEREMKLGSFTKCALFYDKGENKADVIRRADELREKYDVVSTFLKKKKFGKQLARAEEDGYTVEEMGN